jgi:hypothetical protein
MAIRVVKTTTGFRFFDRGISHDYRMLRNVEWLINASDMGYLSQFFRNSSYARSSTFELILGSTPTGFFPAGPDLGDVGTFTFRMIETPNQSGVLYRPWKRFTQNMSFVLVSAPSYTPPPQLSEGDFQIGTVSGLLWPQDGIDYDMQYLNTTVTSSSGVPYSLDQSSRDDIFVARFLQQGNLSKMAALVNYLKSASGRTLDISVVAPSGMYFAGIDRGSSDTYTTKLVSTTLSIEHNRFDGFEVPLEFWVINP